MIQYCCLTLSQTSYQVDTLYKQGADSWQGAVGRYSLPFVIAVVLTGFIALALLTMWESSRVALKEYCVEC